MTNSYVIKSFPTPTQIKNLDESEETKPRRQALKEFIKNRVINKRTFSVVRDYLLIIRVINNASCPSPVTNMTLGELKLLNGMLLSLA